MNFLLLGVDSLIAGAAICMLVEPGKRVVLAALFGVADVVGFMIGAGLGWQISESASVVLQTTTLVAMGLYLVVVAASLERLASWPVWVVPWALTLDNIAYGLAGNHSTGALLGEAGQQALSSALLAYAGLMVAVVLPRAVPVLQQRVLATRFAGGALVLAAGGFMLLG
jgi:hypothetical protein